MAFFVRPCIGVSPIALSQKQNCLFLALFVESEFLKLEPKSIHVLGLILALFQIHTIVLLIFYLFLVLLHVLHLQVLLLPIVRLVP